jgi:hypothetical protein
MPSEYCNFGEERRPYSDSGEFLEMYTLDVILKSQSQEAFDRSLIHDRLARAIASLGSSKNSPRQHVVETFVDRWYVAGTVWKKHDIMCLSILFWTRRGRNEHGAKRDPVLRRRVVGNDRGDMITQGVFYIETRDLDKSMR